MDLHVKKLCVLEFFARNKLFGASSILFFFTKG